MRRLIKNGYLIDPEQGLEGYYDLLTDGSNVERVAPRGMLSETEANAEVLDAAGLTVLPGFVDMHCHLREPGFSYKETIASGTAAAAAGGFTTVCAMPNTAPVIDSAESLTQLKEILARDAVVRVLPVGAMTIGQAGTQLTAVKELKQGGVIALSEDGKSVMDSVLARRAMLLAAEQGLPVLSHCEDKLLADDGILFGSSCGQAGVMHAGKRADSLRLPGISGSVEDIIAARDIILAQETGAQLHLCHCSTKNSVALLQMAQSLGIPVTAEACPHHFALCDEDITEDSGRFKMNPPLRSRADMEEIRLAIGSGLIPVIATDHAPHSIEEKSGSMKTAPFGIVGFETAFALTVTELVETGYLTKAQLVARMSATPAKLLSLRAGSLQRGYPADLVLVDMETSYTIDASRFLSKGRSTPFDGKTVRGRVLVTFCGGALVYDGR